MYFIGDAGIDEYLNLEKNYLGGCSLNVAGHYRLCSKLETHLIFPTITNNPIESYCEEIGITHYPLYRNGELPRQEIDIQESGEKIFVQYHPGVIEGFVLGHEEKLLLKKCDTIVAPLFTQILPFIDQVIEVSDSKFIFDFHDASDFNKDINEISKYLKHASMAQFGLTLKDENLKAQLVNKSIELGIELLITQGSDEIYYLDAKSNTEVRYTPTKIEKVFDSTGAGDSFLGAFLYYKQVTTIHDALAKASTYAAQTLQYFGPLPHLSHI